MGCFMSKPSNIQSNPAMLVSSSSAMKTIPVEEIIIQIPNSTVHLMEEGQSLQLGQGSFTLSRLIEDGVVLATIVKVGKELQWPLTKDEPVVKLDELHYLFSLPGKEGEVEFINYGVAFTESQAGLLRMLDSFLKDNSCFTTSGAPSPSPPPPASREVYWKEFAPKVEDYNGVLARAIAGGTGEIVKGIFRCTSAYTKQVERGGSMMIQAAPVSSADQGAIAGKSSSRVGQTNEGIKKGLKRARMVSKMTEKMSKRLLEGAMVVSGSISAPLIRSQAGKRFFAMVPGEVLLASLDAINKLLDAVEAAEKEAFSATSKSVSGVVSRKYGEDAGQMTEDVFATARHTAGTAWNIFKLRKAFNPASNLPSSLLKNAAKTKKH